MMQEHMETNVDTDAHWHMKHFFHEHVLTKTHFIASQSGMIALWSLKPHTAVRALVVKHHYTLG